jgi:hypothetical protein
MLKRGLEYTDKLIMFQNLFLQLLLMLSVDLAVAAEGQIILQDLPAGGTFNTILKAPSTLPSDLTFVLPDGNGSSGDLLITDGQGMLSWGSADVNKIKICEIAVGNTYVSKNSLVDEDDTTMACGNKFGATLTITEVECYADAGSPSVMPKISGGSDLLSSELTCGNGSFTSGTLNGTPAQTVNQTIDGNIVVAGGAAKYIVIRITRTLP